MTKKAYQTLYLHQLGDLLRLQSSEEADATGPMLTIDLKSCAIGVSTASTLLKAEVGAQRIYAVLGIQKLRTTAAIVVVTGIKKVALLRGHPVYEITSTRVIAGPISHTDDERFLELLRYAVYPSGVGKRLFFSYEADLTLTQQRYAELHSAGKVQDKPLHARSDLNFFFNYQLVSLLLATHSPEVERFVIPVIMGSIQQLTSVSFGSNTNATISLIARRAVQRPGMRHWRRGADAEGAVANFVETEQLVELQTDVGQAVSGFVQIRGSIPLLWSQVPNIRYKPTTRLAPPSASQPAFNKHVSNLVRSYKGIVAVNLANQHGSEGLLSSAFEKEAKRLDDAGSKFRLVQFDFHKECGATHYDRLLLLWKEVASDFERFAYFSEGLGPAMLQKGVFRVNCIDCLDRTNVVQGVFARHHLESFLRSSLLLPDPVSLPATFPKVEAMFKILWANHGDDISMQYAGTGALKSGFTRTGVRTKAGLLDDGIKSGMRYYLNNFSDGHKQDALDLITGTYAISPEKPSPFKARQSPSPILPLLMVITGAVLGIAQLISFLLGWTEGSLGKIILRQVFLPLALSFAMIWYVVKNGKTFVSTPRLRPDLAQAW